MPEIISIEESRRLVDLEKTIQSGLQTFVEVGEALAEIRDSRLYRIEYGTFEEYCKTKWHMSKRHCDRLISSSETAKKLGPIGPAPQAESQTRPLTKLPAEQRAGAWEKAVKAAGGEQPTAKQVEDAVQEVSSASNPIESKPLHPTGSQFSYAITYANLAITQLQKIDAKDSQRSEALDRVISWINTNR